ncbi:MAG TPA: cupin domain-containing protein [Bacteroidales bacterium]|nr:cupin domain-containing protein [Bacteroidales bacterium]
MKNSTLSIKVKRSSLTSLAMGLAVTVFALSASIPSYGQERQRPGMPAQDAQKPVPLAQRIGHSDKSKAMESKNIHQGTGTLFLQTLLGRNAVTGLNFMHKGPLMPKSSIGHHFHNNSDEMFLILDADCQFTVNGQTAAIAGPVGVPCRSGNSHAVYNPSTKPAEWVNFQVAVVDPNASTGGAGGFSRGSYNVSADPSGLYEMGDDRSKAVLEPKATFMNTGQLTRASQRPVVHMNGGKDTVYYRRALGPSAFASNWAYFDHLTIPAKASQGRHYHAGVDEVYLAIKGKGKVYVNDDVADFAAGDAIPIKAGEIHSFESSQTEPLEMVIYGVALEKGKLDVVDVPLKMMQLQMFFEVAPENYEAFEKSYIEVYVPALRKQVGYMGSRLLRKFSDEGIKKIGGAATKYTFEMVLLFDTEEHRVAWTKTPEHDVAWAKTISYAKSYEWIGYDITGLDQVSDPLGKRNITAEEY